MQLENNKEKNNKKVVILATKHLTRAAIFAGIYFVASIFMQPIAYGPLQFRPAEAMTLLPIIFPEAIIGLTIGCLLSNIFSPFGWYDMVFGTLATLIAAVLTFAIGKILHKQKISIKALVGSVPPILVNALILPLVWLLFSGNKMYWLNFAMILGTQTATIILLGLPLLIALNKAKSYEERFNQS